MADGEPVPPPPPQPSNGPILPINFPIPTKLNHENYLTWQAQILPALFGYDLMKYIELSPPSPTISDSTGRLVLNPEYVAWKKQDQLLLAWLMTSLTESVQAQVVSHHTCFDLWKALHKTYASTSRSRLTAIRRQVLHARKGSMSCAEYLQQIRRLADELAFAGDPLTDEQLVTAAIDGLDSDYNPIIATVNAAARHDPFTFSDLHGLLTGHEALLRDQLASSSAPSAFATGKGNGFFKNKSGSANLSTTGQKFNSQPGTVFDQSKSKPVCQICSRVGHFAKLCYSRYNKDPEWKPNPRLQAYNTKLNKDGTSSTDWVIDSGATNHVTSDLNNLTSFFAYQGTDTLHIGSGMGLSIQNVGSSTVQMHNCIPLTCVMCFMSLPSLPIFCPFLNFYKIIHFLMFLLTILFAQSRISAPRKFSFEFLVQEVSSLFKFLTVNLSLYILPD